VRHHEPVHAHDGGDDGLAVVRRVVAHAARLLRQGGHVFLELGGEQDVALADDLERNGFTALQRWYDDDGDLRGITATQRVRP
jgi:release factor glutamine methyltransferase